MNNIYSQSFPTVNSEERVRLIKECHAAGFRCWDKLYPLINAMAAMDSEIREGLKSLVEEEKPMEKGANAWDASLRLDTNLSDPLFTDWEAEFILLADEFWLAQRWLFIAVCEMSRKYATRFPQMRSREEIAKREEVLHLIDEDFSGHIATIKISRAKSLARGAEAWIEESTPTHYTAEHIAEKLNLSKRQTLNVLKDANRWLKIEHKEGQTWKLTPAQFRKIVSGHKRNRK